MATPETRQGLSQEKIQYLTTCGVPDCDRRVFRYKVAKWYGRPLCVPHYYRVSKYGNPLDGPPIRKADPITRPVRRQLWKDLNRWTMRVGLKFRAISCKSLGKDYNARYVAFPAYATGPRAPFSKHLYPLQTLLFWERIGWVRLIENAPDDKTYEVQQTRYEGLKLRWNRNP